MSELRGREPWLVALAVAALVLTTDARAQDRAFPASDRDILAAVCPAGRAGRIEFVVDAGHHGTTSLSVVRVRTGPRRCCEERGYRDYLVSARGGSVRRERLLVRGECPCLEWQRSIWRFRHGELLLTSGGMGAPPAAGTDLRATTLHIRPWPFRITAAFRGDERDAETPPTPARGPIAILSME